MKILVINEKFISYAKKNKFNKKFNYIKYKNIQKKKEERYAKSHPNKDINELNPYSISREFFNNFKSILYKKLKVTGKGINPRRILISHKKFNKKEIVGCFLTYYGKNNNSKLRFYIYPKLIKNNSKLVQIFILEKHNGKKGKDYKVFKRSSFETLPSLVINLISILTHE